MAVNYFSLVQGTSVVEFSEVMLSLNVPPSDLAKITWVCSKKEHVLLALSETDKVIYGGWMVATGRNPGQKLKVGDMRTPEGVFYVKSIEDSSFWGSYVDKATKERIGYGPYFIRLETGWKGIGIHGTDDEHLHEIGTDASHGCIRMANDDLLEVVSMSMKGQKVVILESLN
ncbi:L,D-transpeptidase [Acetomicrobium hydrogeniformans]|nr:L,D-transpeptidase [Acetomicrobium hydrogeniformans]